jgi:hypothetical protein
MQQAAAALDTVQDLRHMAITFVARESRDGETG